MVEVVALSPHLTRPEAVSRLGAGRLRDRLGLSRGRRLRGLRQVYVPYRLFRATVTNRGREQVLWLALDTVTGRLDPYRFDAPPEADTAGGEAGAALLAGRVALQELRERALGCLRREVFRRGFFRLADLRLAVDDAGREVHVPYWVGVFERDGRASIEVWNAVRRQREGAKLCELIEEWLASRDGVAADASAIPG